MATAIDVASTPDGSLAVVRRLDRHDLAGLARVLPPRWLRLNAADWRAVYR